MKKTDIHKLDFKQNKIDKKLFGGKFFDESFWFDVLEIKKSK